MHDKPSGPLPADRFAWPLFTLDVEASGLGRLTYPIEVAVCRWDGPGRDAETRHSLISPDPSWLARGVWIDSSERVHGIRLRDLEGAPSAAETVAAIDAFVPLGAVAFCDGGGHDSYWMQRLADAARRPVALLLGGLDHLSAFMDDGQLAAAAKVREAPTEHRAAPDAERHVLCLASALGLEAPSFRRRPLAARG